MEETNLRNRKPKPSSTETVNAAIAASTGTKSTDIHNAKDDSHSKGKTPDGTGLYFKETIEEEEMI